MQGPTDYIESNTLLFACEPETYKRAGELIAEMSNDALLDLRQGAERLLMFIRIEQGNRARQEQYECKGETNARASKDVG